MKRRPWILLLLFAALAVDRPLAQMPDRPSGQAPSSARPEKIVRVSFVEGDASYQRGDAEGWNALGINTPLMTGDSLYTSRESRAEVTLGRGSYARLDDDTQIDLVSVTSEITQLGIDSGRLDLSVHSMPEGASYEIDTPSATATLRESGVYRITVDDRRATFEVVAGGLSVLLNGEQLDVGPEESLSLENSDPPTYEYAGPHPPSAFDQWASARDGRLEHSESARYVNHQVEGQLDLDAHGSWRPDPTYGHVWVPAGVGPEWAPYQDGRWVWQDPYGWTWVSYEDWGWAPYHYGRWVSTGGGWAWVPPPPEGYVAARGVIMPEPVYAPALVAFVGGSGWHVGVSVGGPSVGWVPLAPAEPYYYAWQPAPTTVVHYHNVTVVNAVTVVQVNNFSQGGRGRIRCTPEEIRRAPAQGYAPRGVTVTQASLVAYPDRHLREGAYPARTREQRPLVTRLVPPPRPMQFAQKQEVYRQTGRPVREPIAMSGDVGKPYHEGARVPEGVRAVSALHSERPSRLVARPGGEEHAHAPRRIEHDMLPVQERPEGRHAGRPEGKAEGYPQGQPQGRPEGNSARQPEGRVEGNPQGRPEGSRRRPNEPGASEAAKPAEGSATAPAAPEERAKGAPAKRWQKPSEAGLAPGNGDHGGAVKPQEGGTPAPDGNTEQPGTAPRRKFHPMPKQGEAPPPRGNAEHGGSTRPAEGAPHAPGSAPETPNAAPPRGGHPPEAAPRPAAPPHQEPPNENKGKNEDPNAKKKEKKHGG
jgi:hypothetical protein